MGDYADVVQELPKFITGCKYHPTQ
jgi:hypothetical protein